MKALARWWRRWRYTRACEVVTMNGAYFRITRTPWLHRRGPIVGVEVWHRHPATDAYGYTIWTSA